MTDEQILQSIKKILEKLHDPKTGMCGAYNDMVAELKKQNLSEEEFNKKRMAMKMEYEDKMCSKYANQTSDCMQQCFMITGKDVMDNRHYMYCGHAAKAFCYVNSTLPAAEQLDLMVLITTCTENLVDCSYGHTLPCVKMSDGKYHAVEPQMSLAKTKGEIPFLDEELEIGREIHHILPSIVSNGNKPYKIMKLLTWEQEEKNNFSDFLKISVERDKKTSLICAAIEAELKRQNLPEKGKYSGAYRFCKGLQNTKLPIVVIHTTDNHGGTADFLTLKIDDRIYRFNPCQDYLYLRPLLGYNERVLRTDNIHDHHRYKIESEMSPADFVKWYGAQYVNARSGRDEK